MSLERLEIRGQHLGKKDISCKLLHFKFKRSTAPSTATPFISDQYRSYMPVLFSVMPIPVPVSDLPDSDIDNGNDIVDIDLDVLLLKTNPLQALQSLQSKLPEVAPQLRRQQHLLCPLCCSGPLAPKVT